MIDIRVDSADADLYPLRIALPTVFPPNSMTHEDARSSRNLWVLESWHCWWHEPKPGSQRRADAAFVLAMGSPRDILAESLRSENKF